MKHHLASIILLVLMVGCSPAQAPTAASPAPTMTASPIPPTASFTPSPLPPTATVIPSPTPLPGKLVLPVDTLGKDIPWLPLDEDGTGAFFVGFNTLRPPFNSALVRQAFSYAIDRQVITEMAEKYKRADDLQPATTLTSPEALGRDLYNEVGIGFDPQKAKQLLTEAGYSDPSVFPTVTIVVNASGDIAPGARFNMATAMVEMWKANLGISVKVEVIKAFKDYGNRLGTNPPEMYWFGWAADYNDPDNFLRGIFHSGSEYNYGRFSNPEFDRLVDRAAKSRDPAERQELYILAERLLCETEAALIPLYHPTP